MCAKHIKSVPEEKRVHWVLASIRAGQLKAAYRTANSLSPEALVRLVDCIYEEILQNAIPSYAVAFYAGFLQKFPDVSSVLLELLTAEPGISDDVAIRILRNASGEHFWEFLSQRMEVADPDVQYLSAVTLYDRRDEIPQQYIWRFLGSGSGMEEWTYVVLLSAVFHRIRQDDDLRNGIVRTILASNKRLSEVLTQHPDPEALSSVFSDPRYERDIVLLGILGSEQAIEVLQKLLANPRCRTRAVSVLIAMENPQIIQGLIDLAISKRDDPATVNCLASRFGGIRNPALIPVLLPALSEPNLPRPLALSIMNVLASLKSAEVYPFLEREIKSATDSRALYPILLALSDNPSLGANLADDIIAKYPLLDVADAREVAALVLGEAGKSSAVADFLAHRLSLALKGDASETEMENLITALGRCAPPNHEAAIQALSRLFPNGVTRRLASSALYSLSRMGGEKALEALSCIVNHCLVALDSTRPGTYQLILESIWALANTGCEKAPVMLQLIASNKEGVGNEISHFAAFVLETLGVTEPL